MYIENGDINTRNKQLKNDKITIAEYKKISQITNSKYKNKITIVDNIKFRSQKEANRYCELKILEKKGEISFLSLQPWFLLIPKSNLILKSISYIADFKYKDNTVDKWVVEDVKGNILPLYKIKKALFLQQYPNFIFKEIL